MERLRVRHTGDMRNNTKSEEGRGRGIITIKITGEWTELKHKKKKKPKNQGEQSPVLLLYEGGESDDVFIPNQHNRHKQKRLSQKSITERHNSPSVQTPEVLLLRHEPRGVS